MKSKIRNIMHTERFLKALAFVLPQECVYAKGHHGDLKHVVWENVSGDGGGVTKFGIDQRSHPKLDIKMLTLEQATEIYFQEYWVKSDAESMPAGYGEVLFDIKVNGGNGPLMLQQALNKVRVMRGLVDLPVLHEDGDIGPKTRGNMVEMGEVGLRQFLKERQYRYDRLGRQESLRKFHQGWTNRNNALARFVGVELGRS
jgi:lysozyme family protein